MVRVTFVLALLVQSVAWSTNAPADIVVEWSQRLLATAEAEDGLLTLKGVREARKFTMETRQVDRAGPMSGKIAMNPPTRSFDSFASAALECALSRVYLGIHFRYDSLAGNELGCKVGACTIRKYLGPAEE